MKLSYQALLQWVDIQLSPEEIAQQLTAAGLEVDQCLNAADSFTGVVIAEVKKVSAHPQADKLSICEVSTGDDKTYTVVCGAQNVYESARVPYAQVNAVLHNANKVIKETVIRNVSSAGMLCSAQDLGMAENSNGLLLLPPDAPLGQNIRDYLQLDDVIFDIQLTPNRGDCLSIMGIAREVAAINHLSLKKCEDYSAEIQHKQYVPIHIEANQACLRYTGRVITQINNTLSTPLWMQENLRRAGIRSISLIVDIMNYVMLEMGQPLHAFDLNKIDHEIQVRYAKNNESLTLLDGKTITLNPDILVIADSQKPLALAGIMGGLESAVSADTSSIFIESAYFVPDAIQGRARLYGLQTDASYRYERGVDPLLPLMALERATQWVLALAGGQAGPVVDMNVKQIMSQALEIDLPKEQIAKLLGMTLADKEILRILQSLGMQVKTNADHFHVLVPSFRFDIKLPEDLIEEIARIYGYTRLPSTTPQVKLQAPQMDASLTVNHFMQTLVGRGFQEVITYSFIDPQLQNLCQPQLFPLALSNPIASDMAVMRMSLWPGLLSVLQYNANRQQSRLRIFEQGLCFVPVAGQYEQQLHLAGLITGTLFPEQWEMQHEADFYTLKQDVMALLSLTHRTDDFIFIPAKHDTLHPGQSGMIIDKDNQTIGYIGAIHPQILQSLDVKGMVYVFELHLSSLLKNVKLPRYQALSRFPSVRRDLAIVVKDSVLANELENEIRSISKPWLQSCVIFDVYKGEPVPAGYKSLAMGLTVQDSQRTLTDVEVDGLIKQLLERLSQKFNAYLRE